MTKRVELEGKVFGRLTVLSYEGSHNGNSKYKCRCSCGNITMAYAAGLRQGNKKSCGCLRNEVNTERTSQKQQRKLAEEFTGMWQLTDPFEADNIFVVGWQIVNYESPACAECGELINEGEQVIWDIRGPRDKRLIHVKHQKEAE